MPRHFLGAAAAALTDWCTRQDVQKVARLKNYFINPAMQHAQEYGSTAQTGLGATTSRWPVDGTQYVAISNTSVVTAQQVNSNTPGGSPFRLRISVTTAETGANAGSSHYLEQRLDGADVADLLLGTSAAKGLAVRFGFKAPAGTYGLHLRASGGTRTYTTSFTISAGQANTDTLQTFLIPGDVTGTWLNTEGTLGLVVLIALQSGTTNQTSSLNVWGTNLVTAPNTITNNVGTIGNVIEVFDWGLYAGSAVPDFEVPDVIIEKWRCMRYFQSYPVAAGATPTTVVENVASVATSAPISQDFILPVPMRGTPTVTFTNTTNVNCGGPSLGSGGTDKSKVRFNITATGASTAGASSFFTWKADARP